MFAAIPDSPEELHTYQVMQAWDSLHITVVLGGYQLFSGNIMVLLYKVMRRSNGKKE